VTDIKELFLTEFLERWEKIYSRQGRDIEHHSIPCLFAEILRRDYELTEYWLFSRRHIVRRANELVADPWIIERFPRKIGTFDGSLYLHVLVLFWHQSIEKKPSFLDRLGKRVKLHNLSAHDAGELISSCTSDVFKVRAIVILMALSSLDPKSDWGTLKEYSAGTSAQWICDKWDHFASLGCREPISRRRLDSSKYKSSLLGQMLRRNCTRMKSKSRDDRYKPNAYFAPKRESKQMPVTKLEASVLAVASFMASRKIADEFALSYLPDPISNIVANLETRNLCSDRAVSLSDSMRIFTEKNPKK
jgi:hypothetical protein